MLVVTVQRQSERVMVMLLVVIEGLLNFGRQKGINFTYNQIID